MQLVGGAVERGSADCVVGLRVIRVLSTAAAGENEISASTARSARTTAAAWSAGARPPASKWSAESLTAAIESAPARAEPLAEFTGHRVELAAADRIEALVHHSAIEARHVSVDRDR